MNIDFKDKINLKGLSVPPFLADPRVFMALGLAVMLMMTVLLFTGTSEERNFSRAQEQGQRAALALAEPLKVFSALLQDEQVQELAQMALKNPDSLPQLQQYLSGRMPEVRSVQVFRPDMYLRNTSSLGEKAWVLMDMLLTAQSSGVAPLQAFEDADGTRLAGMVRLGSREAPTGYLLVTAAMSYVYSSFNMTFPAGGYIALEQNNGRFAASNLKAFGDRTLAVNGVNRIPVAGSLFRVVVPSSAAPSAFGGSQRLLFFLLGGLLLAFGAVKHRQKLHPVRELTADPEALDLQDDADGDGQDDSGSVAPSDQPVAEKPQPEEPKLPEVSLSDLSFNLDERRKQKELDKQPVFAAPVELTAGIFRAYDIRGIVGETLDADIARQVGQAIGTQALEEEATPVVVARDGRHSGPDLVKGMIEGISSTGCAVIDIGAVPTGVLYFAAYECGSGSGVMVTGSHNPPDYNGFKAMLGGATLSGERITGLYERLQAGNVRIGKGAVTQEEMLDAYQDRIAGDIQLKRPIKVVADCGNGIGGVCAADVLRSIGAEVLPLFDEVDGDFPNHHPDPSDPHNLEDLIQSVQLMGADLGVAFDGDADRLGVVTPDGEIIYSDRLMMLFAREVLSRNEGAPIIYDVKCTGKLDAIIREAGGAPEMFKTGHSLIKNRMKEVDAPFAGEMSGHFFFKDRWYGFDCGIYSAARLLEILAMDERTPEQVLNSLPNSISTPELKVHTEEGENHAFVEQFQEKAKFADARISTIDGLRADYEYGWGLVRASNTTPILVVRFEADTEESLQIIQEAFRMQMLSVNPDLKLPF